MYCLYCTVQDRQQLAAGGYTAIDASRRGHLATHAGLVFERGTWYRALTWDVIAFRGDEVEAEREDEGKE